MHSQLIVYLCGPMAGLTVKQCREWRVTAAEVLRDAGFGILDPTRELLGLPDDHVVAHDADDKRVVFERDRFDATRADILLVNLLHAKAVSLGSSMEMAWAHLARKFIVTVLRLLPPEEPNPHRHTFIREASSIIVPTVEDGTEYIVTTFSGRE